MNCVVSRNKTRLAHCFSVSVCERFKWPEQEAASSSHRNHYRQEEPVAELSDKAQEVYQHHLVRGDQPGCATHIVSEQWRLNLVYDELVEARLLERVGPETAKVLPLRSDDDPRPETSVSLYRLKRPS